MRKNLHFIYPAMIALFPVLNMYANNVGEVDISEIGRSIVFVTFLAVLLGCLLWLWFRDWHKSAPITSYLIFILMLYGSIYDSLRTNKSAMALARHRVILPVSIIILIALAWYVSNVLEDFRPLEIFATWFSIFILITPLYMIITYQMHHISAINKTTSTVNIANATQPGIRPDVYYIILDGYGREDTLKKYYSFDNSRFINQLKNLGFYVAEKSTSNYPQTLLSLASSMNMQYIDDTLMQTDTNSEDRRGLADKVVHSKIRSILENMGYQTIGINSGYSTSMPDADIYFSYDENQAKSQKLSKSKQAWETPLNSFEGILFQESIVMVFYDLQIIPKQTFVNAYNNLYFRQAGRILFEFETLGQIPELDGDYFVFAHIVAPHPPFVFGAEGQLLSHDHPFTLGDGSQYPGTRDEYIESYTDQMLYVNTLTLKAISSIIEKSDIPPIIIIQGDHGPKAYLDWESVENSNIPDLFSNLNAYFLGGSKSAGLYPTITPVNSFRVLLKDVFGIDSELLPDKNYFASWSHPFIFIDVTDKVKQ